MDGFGSHTFSLINANNKRVWTKFHFKNHQGHQYWTNAEAAEIVGKTRESTQEDLFQAIEAGNNPKWTLSIQIMQEDEARKAEINPFDVTKVWPHGDFPLHEVGIMELNRNPNNYFAEIEQLAFSPSNIIPGIGFSPDKMLQGRLFSYADAHRHRIGTHYEALPTNAPRCPVHHYHKDGAMRFYDNNTKNPDAYYEPNSFDGPVENKAFKEPPLGLDGDADRFDHHMDNDDFIQVRNLFNLFDQPQRARLFSNIAAAMTGVPEKIVERQLALFAEVDKAYAAGVRSALQQ